jgi:hypothetical protein
MILFFKIILFSDLRELAVLGVRGHRGPLRALVRAGGELKLFRGNGDHLIGVDHKLDDPATTEKRLE